VIISLGALFAIPSEDIIKNKEYALAAGAGNILGSLGTNLVILGAILATSSAISGTIFGASRLMSVIAKDGYFPNFLSIRKTIVHKIQSFGMASMASILILIGGLELILEFGSITFLLVSLLMAVANYKIREKTNSSKFLTALSILD
jgi:amino acid transporter